MKVLKILYLIFWTICLILVFVAVFVFEMKLYQKILYIVLTPIAYASVIYLFKGDKYNKKKH